MLRWHGFRVLKNIAYLNYHTKPKDNKSVEKSAEKMLAPPGIRRAFADRYLDYVRYTMYIVYWLRLPKGNKDKNKYQTTLTNLPCRKKFEYHINSRFG